MIKTVYRDSEGSVINIGEWVSKTPPPENHTVSDEECIEGWDGGMYAKEDPRAVK